MSWKQTNLYPFGCMIESVHSGQNIMEVDVSSLREIIQRDQLLVLRNFKTFNNSDELAHYCETWGEVSVWPFGKVLELIERENPEDHIFDNSYMPLHWDGMYRKQVPEYQVFHCVQAPLSGQGGRTTFSNTILALRNASPGFINQGRDVIGIYQRKMEFYHSKVVSPLITKHPYKDVSVIRYNEPPTQERGDFVNPPDLEFIGLNQEQADGFHSQFKETLYDPAHFYAHEWQAGDVVIADNFSLLHGREGFVSKASRHIQRVHVLSDPPFNNPGLESYL